ncbi:unnamed protein product [Brachionus calyciflorus]|uniref:Uncharacterized protein n=1 Tax=Brachionus calyciflorus TaxID=104777 RepID=A0A814EK67_9BILA|nr:unnamed protein product [Brachionus calyciflorus]
MNMEIEYIKIDTDSEDGIIWIENESFSKKRELSIESISNCVESISKRSQPEQDLIIIQSEVKKKKSVFTLAEFWLHDERLDKSNYYNIVEDEGLDIDLLVWCQMEIYIKSVINYLAIDLISNINIEKTSIQSLLRLGLKIKLTDIYLTDYFIKTCKHMLKFDALESCDRNKKENDEEGINERESLDEDFYDTDEGKQIQLKSSSPFSNMKKSSSCQTSFVSKEQIIGIEIVCQVSSDNYNTAETLSRTTTLTPRNN